MELTPRKMAIIAEIVKAHIENGEPIGSKQLAARLPDAPSSATLRNEMSDLREMGYLEQPHTSAGSIPTNKAYRLYVSELMGKETLNDESKEIIDAMLAEVRPDPEAIGSSAARILSELTGLTAVSAPSIRQEARLKKVSIMPMGRGSAVIFVIADDGRTASRLIRTGNDFTPELQKRFDEICAEKVCGKELHSLDPAYLQTVAVTAGLDVLSLAPLFSCVFEMAGDFRSSRINLGGEANILTVCPAEGQARRAMELLRSSEVVGSIFSAATSPVGVVFGDDTGYSELHPTGMIVASFGEDKELGRLALIGPTRMEYEKLLPNVEYLAKRIGSIMTEVLKGLEE